MYSVLLSIFPFSMLALFGIGLELFFFIDTPLCKAWMARSLYELV